MDDKEGRLFVMGCQSNNIAYTILVMFLLYSLNVKLALQSSVEALEGAKFLFGSSWHMTIVTNQQPQGSRVLLLASQLRVL